MALRILLVEDNADARLTLTRLLRKLGHNIFAADCRQKAFDVVKSTRFDVLLSDINLPDGTGYDVISQAKRKHAISSVSISGFGATEDIRKSKEAGFDFHLTKPLDFQELCGILRDFES